MARTPGNPSTPRAPLTMIAVMTPNRVLGKAGKLPWQMPEDLAHFKRATTGHAVIMGRVTYDSVGTPLPKRRNIIISRDPALQRPGAEVAPTLERAIALARQTDPDPFIIGGAQIYAEALPLATRMILTYLDHEYEGDAFFPAFDAGEWIEEDRRRGDRDPVTFVTLRRVDAA